MNAEILPDGRLRIPVSFLFGDDGIGTTTKEVGPGDPDYHRWMDYYQRSGEKPDSAEMDEEPAPPHHFSDVDHLPPLGPTPGVD